MAANPPLTSKPAIIEPIKWVVFRGLEKLSDLRGNSVAVPAAQLPPPSGRRSLWVFISTIGELNAIGPFLRALHTRLDHLDLVLITDHEHYREPYLAQYPDATVFVTRGHGDDAQYLARHLPPAMLVVAEIPALPSDAPCRFSYAFMRAVKKHGAPAILVNGWLYHYQPGCRMDNIEYRLFRRDFVRLFDVACVQNEEVRHSLIQAGADPNRVAVTGNIKFDAMQRADWTPAQARSPVLLSALLASGRPTVVAGCVTDYAEQQRVLDAFLTLRTRHPEALLVLAPRHPEVDEHMVALKGFIAERGIEGLFRSRVADIALPNSTACLVLDTIGELKDFYAAATVAYVGVDHNILEPLSFEKPVTISPGWVETYPSYPVYQAMVQTGAVLQIGPDTELGTTWLRLIDQKEGLESQVRRGRNAILSVKGATHRCFNHINLWIKL